MGFLVACLAGVAAVAAGLGAAAAPAKAPKRNPTEKDAEAFLATVTALLAPVSTSATLADWQAATDVTPEHTGQRTGADKAYAALAGSTMIIDKSKALLKNKGQLEEATAHQLTKLLLGHWVALAQQRPIDAETPLNEQKPLEQSLFCSQRWP